MTSKLAPTLQAFFTDRLLTQRQASPRTVVAYRDTLRLLLSFAQQRTGRPPCQLDLADLNADLVAAFLTHLEHDRGNSVRTRNARLAAIHSLFRFAALRHPEHAELIARVLDIPAKRYDRVLVNFLTPTEVDALLAAPGPGHLARAPRPRPAGVGHPNRATGQRACPAHPRRRPPRRRPTPALPRQRPQGTRYPADSPDRRRAARLDA